MGFSNVVKNTSVVISLTSAVISGMKLPQHIEMHCGEWAKIQASSWVQDALTEGQVTERQKRKATSMKPCI